MTNCDFIFIWLVLIGSLIIRVLLVWGWQELKLYRHGNWRESSDIGHARNVFCTDPNLLWYCRTRVEVHAWVMLVHATREGMLNGKLQGIIAMHNPPLTCCFFHIVVEAAGLQKEKKNMLRVRQTFLEIFWSFFCLWDLTVIQSWESPTGNKKRFRRNVVTNIVERIVDH